ncbi:MULTISPECIES: FtsB family cell division protein [Allobacillus]|uniref:Septum formation initiator family protein n=1 Tax=Allobacillus halotolerans TaxID=570278 RepID=A0ABS6GNS8_9BACI|nr:MULTISPECIES: septum formation initiator family protein [Allobacillus]MBU6080138.1 septum formation initiator family protein [Allobacillus halotolerans]TSJ65410.1 septum formation initiator family protein [Allobacillus sp. SKP2-8]
MERRKERNKDNIAKINSTYAKQQEKQMAQKSREKKLLFRRLIAFVFLFVLICGGMTTYHFQQRAQMQEKQAEYQQLNEKMTQLTNRNETLKEEVEKLSDIDYLLQIARKDYFFSKDGEIIFKLPDEEPSY